MIESIVPMVVITGMFAMIFGIVYLKSRENLALIEKGINPKQNKISPKPFLNLKWGLLLIGSGLGLLFAFIIDNAILPNHKNSIEQKVISKNTGHTIDIKNDSNSNSNSKNNGEKTIIVNEKISDDDKDAIDEIVTKDTSVNKKKRNTEISFSSSGSDDEYVALYFALIAIGGGIGLFISYKIEKKEWLDKKQEIA